VLLPETPTLLPGPEWCTYGAKTYTQFATWAAEDYLAWRAATRVHEAGKAYRESIGNVREQVRYRVKDGAAGGPHARRNVGGVSRFLLPTFLCDGKEK
jgi:hypothetical protein